MQQDAIPFRYLNDKYLDSIYSETVSKAFVTKPFPLHWHEFYEMEFIVQGEGRHHLNGNDYRIGKGSMFLLSPAEFHAVIPAADNPLRLINVKFSDTVLCESVRKMLLSNRYDLVTEFAEQPEFGQMEQQFERLYEEYNDERPGKEAMIRNMLERLIIELLRKVAPRREGEETLGSSGTITKALSYIHQHYSEPLSLETVARHSNMSVSYFSELFHKETGCMFRNYLQNCRLQAAYSMTMTSTLPIADICYSSGFNSLPHFYRAFKQKYSLSPSALRKRNTGVR
ncbi:MAG: transcriptional regulator, AraC family [Paenibacillus sp.]|jgi:AraC-like DNA-binding protein|nr:transcriptional regulator, AraC family [Paenibacillus sp.]